MTKITIDLNQKYVDDRIYFIKHKGEDIVMNDFRGLDSDDLKKVFGAIAEWLKHIDDSAPIPNLLLADFTNVKVSNSAFWR